MIKVRQKITKIQLEKAYNYAKLVYFKNISRKETIDSLVKIHMNKSSAIDYIMNFQYLMDNVRYRRTLNTESTEYYLLNINKKYGLGRLNNALSALKKHIEYYKQIKKTNMVHIEKY